MKTILVTGGAGYIGSHVCVQLLEAGYEIIVVDNLCNSSEESLRRVQKLAGRELIFYQVDLRDKEALDEVFTKHGIEGVIHFAALKAVGESVENPVAYYQNNVEGALVLFELMQKHGVSNFVFSSSATVYGDPATVPITEDFPIQPTNPYGYTKSMLEQILQDIRASNPSWNAAILRYFNPVGAHKSGEIGESPRGIPNNISPYIAQVAVGKREKLSVYGDDYDTPDGTRVRDYIHVEDLAAGHLKALVKLTENPGVVTYNLGTGRGYSVIELIHAFEEITGRDIPYEVVGRRTGDIATCYANSEKANRELGWHAERNLAEMVEDAWRWQTQYPDGFDS